MPLRLLQRSVEEGNVPHCGRVALPVHQHLMPIVQHNRGVVGMPHSALGIQGRVAPHRPPRHVRAVGCAQHSRYCRSSGRWDSGQ